MPKKEDRKYGITWSCCGLDLEHEAMMKHLQEKHGLDPKTTKVRKRMVMHMDGQDWYSSAYECEAELSDGKKLQFAQYTCNKRTGEDLAYWQ